MRWFSAGPIEPHTLMMGWPIYWWARVGKIAETVGAASVLIDIIGPERLKEWAKRHRRRVSVWQQWTVFLTILALSLLTGFYFRSLFGNLGVNARVVGILTMLVQVVLLSLVVNVITAVTPKVITAVLNTLDRDRPAHVWRVIAFALLLIGFSFDILGA
jgi:ABC-type bacteriocin/lantibiotic exporter with double-glycine peptidase domain